MGSTLREGWISTIVEESCEINYGTRVVRKRDAGTKYPVYGGGGATFSMDITNRKDCFVIARFAMSERCTRFVKGEFFLNDSGLTVQPKDNGTILQKFLDLQFLYHNDTIYSLARGAAQKNLNVPAFKKMQLNYPKSLKEQEKIVALLDEAFLAIERAKTNAELNLQNAKELFDSYLQAVFENRGEGWEEKTLEEICTKITDGVHKKPTYTEDGIPFIKINNLTKGDGISFDNVSYISKEDHELYIKRTHPEKNDILITKDGTIGIVRIIDTDIEFSIFVSVALIKPINKQISPYLRYILTSPYIQNQIKPKGAALKHLYLKDLRKFIIPLAPLNEQKTIVKKLNTLQAQTKKLESIYTQKLSDLEELKKSILQKAFNGELI